MQPVSREERIHSLDMMRGFSLLGIFLVNMLVFHSPFLYINPYSWYQTPEDIAAFSFIDQWVQGSVYPLFSMIFGYGIAIQYERATARGDVFWRFGVRRMLVLLGFGLIHAFLIWNGDILLTYALAGFLVLGLLRLSWRFLLGIALALYALPNVGLAALLYLGEQMGGVDPSQYAAVQELQDSISAYGLGSFADIFSQRIDDWIYTNGWGLFHLIPTIILPYVLLGVVARKTQLLERFSERKAIWITLIFVGLAAGTFIKFLPYTLGDSIFTVYIQDIFGGPLQAVAYAGIIAFLTSIRVFQKVFHSVALAGRMSLTIYIMQSLIATTLFYSYGFGLYGKVDVLAGTMIAIGIFILQLIFAQLWFSKFMYGPLEKVWRKLSYQTFM
ncbi:DUF418 domain-containing protein [Paenisporosarcina cavernae]|uniref:DUF418 domain-containing protein n=1 Tax=Paenisporosarcina cavernae TaxID=2320858 RepID=A0A385YQI3_9BACL|nr:DUF418 domain-containing protein [Paenisporosarcina cavernae]AYC28995.1 DUF418 domain-containing protein [Paenisporosarcina cavernae]